MDIKSLAVKSTIGLVGLGGLGTGGYYGISAINGSTEVQKKELEPKTPSIEEALRNEGYTLLSEDTQNNDSWNAILGSYKEIIKKQKDLEFENFTGEEPAERTAPTAIDTLKKKCSEIKDKLSNDNETLKKAKKWCVTPVNVADLLKNREFKALKTNTNNANEEESEWKSKITAYRKAKKANQNIETFIDIQDSTEITPDNIVKAKEKCKGFSAILNHAENFETSLSSYEAWCGNK